VYDRYAIFSSPEDIKAQMGFEFSKEFSPNYNAAPSQLLPIVTAMGGNAVQLFHWGATPELAKSKTVSQKLINLPLEQALGRPMYANMLKSKRCIILANGFYLWKQTGKKQKIPYFSFLPGNALHAIAGIWDEFDTLDGKSDLTFNMLLVPTQGDLTHYGANIPAILTANAMQAWLQPEINFASISNYATSFNQSELLIHAVSPGLLTSDNNTSALLKPVVPADQFGNYTLFS
jgi:putative SOS response-associated peptidase YedK